MVLSIKPDGYLLPGTLSAQIRTSILSGNNRMATTEEGEHVLPDGTKLYSKTWKVRLSLPIQVHH